MKDIKVTLSLDLTKPQRLEQESQLWHGNALRIRKTKKAGRANTSPPAAFVGERAAAYRAYAQALESALALLDPPNKS